MGLQKDILATLAYFDVFNYPVTFLEVFQFLGQASNPKDLSRELKKMVDEGTAIRPHEKIVR